MPSISFLRTATFRVAVLQALLFALVVAGLFGFVWGEIHDYVADQSRTGVQVDTAALKEAALTGTLALQIRQRIAAAPVGASYYLLSNASGESIAGNLIYTPRYPGWQTVPIHGARGHHKGHASRVDLFVTRLRDGNWLTVGRDNRDLGELDEDLSRFFYRSVGVAVLFAMLSGGIAGHFFVKHVDRLSAAAERIVTGEEPGPLRFRGGGIEFERLAGRLNRILERVRVLMENMRQVSNDIAHDLRTPLTRLRHRLETAHVNSEDIPLQHAAIEQSLVEVDDVLATFGALLRISRIQARERQAGFATFNLSELFVSMVEEYAPVAEDSGQHVCARVDSDVNFSGDRALLTQMLSNLVENAIHHTPSGTHITLSLRHTPDGVIGSVEDSGPGIPREEQARVFQRFVRLDSSRTSPGSGLGLALVAAIAELHRVPINLLNRHPGLAVVMRFS